ncbi:PAS domain S-box [Cylindrospermum stagnale PCC 7417]|uniref:histidine kinase n=1 Tax=Cylindrospermum stagnale PCC 7417 TaxID=56107 RepID=K9WWC4_9NOST|nr:response regulator [Cylindrospermum stagnale]AFZ24099.1 PAS domain S-box [Cylindrospermum stagnale PCC 7417]
MKILVVEDDELNAYALTAVLTDQNYAVEVASDGDVAWDLIETYNYDLILLDVMLPKLDGISLCRQIRASGRQVPILLLTGCGSSHEKATGLDAGADDYVVKPFEQEELVARVRALLRRGGVTSQPVLEWSSLRLDPSSCEVTYADDLLSLTPKEYALLELFLRNNRRVFSCGMILEHLWSYEDTPGEEAVRTHIKGLRQKLKAVGAPGDLVETVYGIGYRLKSQEEEGAKISPGKSSGTKQPESDLPKQQQTLAAIGGIWQRFRGRVDEQVKVLEQAAVAVGQKCLNLELRSQATQEAHTLAGSLGTFGLAWANDLARRIELLLKSGKTLSASEISNLQTWVKLLRQEIEVNAEKAVFLPPTVEENPLVLVVEGDTTLGEQLATESANWGLKVKIATSLDAARTQLYQKPPSVVLLDPSVAAHQEDSGNFLGELCQCQPPIPVLVFTDQTDFTNRLQVARNGRHTFLQKPMPTAQVLEAVTQVLQNAPHAEAKILVVDDDPKILALLQTLLSPWGLKVIALNDPRQFWETLEAVTPDMLILDVEMPYTNGIELCQVVRNDPRWSELPILFLTVHSDAEIVNQVFSIGADDFVSKPIIGPELVTRIINRLERIRLRRRITQTPKTPVAEQENHWRAIFDAEPECVKMVAADGTLLAMNPAGLAMIEANSSTTVIGKSVYSLIAPEYQEAFRKLNESVCQGNHESMQFEIISFQGNRRWLETHAVPLRNKADGKIVQLAITRDITQNKRAETEIGRMNRTIQTLSACNQALVRAQDESELLQQICQIIVEVGGYRLAWVGLAEHDAEKHIRPAAQAGYEDGSLQSLNLSWGDTIHGQCPAGLAIRTGKTSIIQNIFTDPNYQIWECQASNSGYTSSIALPLTADNQAFGALNIYAAIADAFDADEVKLLKELADDLAYGIVALRNQRDRQLAQMALRESEERLSLALEAVNLGSWDWNITTNQIIWSDSNARLYGLAPGTFNGTYEAFCACVLPEDREALQQSITLACQQKIDYSHEFRVVWPDGSIHWIERKGRFYYNAAGEPIRMLGTSKDISERQAALHERKQVESALQQSESSYQQLVELCPEAIFIQNEEKFVFLNSAAINLFGATQAEELLGKQILDFVHPSSQAVVQERITYLREIKQPVPLLEQKWMRLDNTVMDLEVVAAPFVYQGKPAAQVVARDITQRKQMEADIYNAKNELELRVAERTGELIKVNQQLQSELDERQRTQEALRISQTRFEGILSIADDAIISIDGNQCITLFNQGAEKIFGYSAQEVIGQRLDLLLPLRFSQVHRQHVVDFGKSPSLARRMGERRELFGRRRDGTEFPAEASISKLDVGQEAVYTVILRDITERKQIERMKDEFVSVVSHELRTPLTSIHGSLGMLASGLLPTDSEQGKRLLQIATDSTERLVRLINDILDIERIESGEVKMERESCNVLDLIGSVVNILQPLADKAKVTLAMNSLSIQLWADPDRIVQTLTNLLSNAIKFSASGSTVWLTAQRQEDEILLMVKDTGRGIPAEKLDSIFERFQQVDSSDSRNHEGTGLGLAISKSIVQQHGGRIWVESVLGEGSSFYFTIPIIEPPQSAELETAQIQVSELVTQDSPLVLVCDDDSLIRTDLRTLLEQRGYRVVAVATGEEAIAQAVSQNPDVILLDLLMPGMNGWETMAVLKEREDTKDIPILICSVYKPCQSNQPGADFVDWLSKPVEESYLLQSLRQLISEPSKRVRILIVEDDNDLADLLITIFERHEIETFLAKTGREAIRLSQRVNPDVLILDLILPESDGFTVVDWLQQHNQLCSIPVFVYSAKDLDASERQRLKLGHTEFLTKGRVTIQEFEQRVMDLLGRLTHNQQAEGDNGSKTNSSG